jgi:hypothetical protein
MKAATTTMAGPAMTIQTMPYDHQGWALMWAAVFMLVLLSMSLQFI